jgi:hypothetical protein
MTKAFPVAHPYWAGTLLGLATIPVFMVLPHPRDEQWAAVLLAIIAGAYIGFAANDGRHSANIIEFLVSIGFGILAIVGLALSPLLIAGGYVAHGIWDLLHHHHGPHADTPAWYIPFCVVYDVIVGAFLFVWWW